mgnify:CR=1 FL=1
MRTLIQALKTKELRNKILFTLGIIIIYRIGSFIPTPGVDYKVVQQCVGSMDSASENFIGLVNLFSGGAMLQLSIFALGVMPYITASIVIQLLRVVIPRFEALHKEGQSGEAKLTQYTRYLTIGLAVLQSTTILVTARSGALFNYQCSQVVPDGSVWNLVVMVLIMTGGTGLIMWMAELVTDKGLGQGMSILIFMSICSGFLPQLWEIGWGTKGTDGNWAKFAAVVGVLLVIMILVIYVELSQRRIPVQYTRRMIGRKMYGGSSTYLPLKINMSGVIPPIFASSILAIPTLIAQFGKSDQSWVKWINSNLATAIRTAVVLVMAWGIVFLTGKHHGIGDIGGRSWIFLILSGVATGLSWLCYYRALQLGEASRVVPIDKFSVVISMVLAFVVLKEAVTVKTVVGGLLITAGTLVLIL